jgi:hypothetical protein
MLSAIAFTATGSIVRRRFIGTYTSSILKV